MTPPWMMSPPAQNLRHTGLTPAFEAITLGPDECEINRTNDQTVPAATTNVATGGLPKVEEAVRWVGLAVAGILAIASLCVATIPTPQPVMPPALPVRAMAPAILVISN